jgi:hypothetical protein
VTGEELEVQGTQVVKFVVRGNTYSHVFTVCELATEADAILGTDFLDLVNAKMDMQDKKMWMVRGRKLNHESLSRRSSEACGVANRTALTVFTRTNKRDRKRACWIGCKPRTPQTPVAEQKSEPERKIVESDAWLVKATETVKIPPRVKQMVVGKIDFRKAKQRPELVCTEPAHLPLEGVLVSRGVTPVMAQPSCSADMTSRRGGTRQLCRGAARQYVHVRLVNFSHEEIEIPKSTVVAVAEEVSPSLLAVINDEEKPKSKGRKMVRRQVNPEKGNHQLTAYVREVTSHLSGEAKLVMENVLLKYAHVFHDESEGKIPGTDVIEHRIMTGDA